MPLFRCLNCKKEFDAPKPACVDCGIDPTTHPRHKDMVVPVVTIHFDPPTQIEGIGKNYAACNARLKVGTPNCGFTSHKESVNCKACLASPLFTEAGEGGISEQFGQRKMTPTPTDAS